MLTTPHCKNVSSYEPLTKTRMGERRGVCRVLVWKSDGKRPLGRPRRRWENNIKMDFQEMGYGGIN
jgi:hypothetical protein